MTLTLRPATPADRDITLTWVNDPTTRAMSFDTHTISPAEHAAWFSARLESPQDRLYIVDESSKPVGLVRFVSGIDGRWELGVNLAPEARRRGLGAEAVKRGMAALRTDWGPVTVWARSRPENHGFARVAVQAGFVELGPTTCRDQAAIAWEHKETTGQCGALA